VAGEKTVPTTNGLKTMEFSRWLSVSTKTGKSETLFRNGTGTDYYYYMGESGSLLSALSGESESAVFARTKATITSKGPTRLQDSNDKLELAVQRVNLRTGSPRIDAGGNELTIDWVVDEAGAPFARIDRKTASKTIEVFANRGGDRLTKVGEIDGQRAEKEEFHFLGLASPGVIEVAVKSEGGLELVGLDTSTGVLSGSLLPQGESTLAELRYDPRFAKVRVAALADGRFHHFDEGDRKLQAMLEKALPGARVAIASKSMSGARVIAQAIYANRGDEFYLFDATTKKLELVAAN
jgi:hypothetical protein